MLKKDINIENLTKTFYFSNSYYNSLDFIYKYTKEVLIEEICGYPKSFFKKIFTNIEDHRFARDRSIESNSLYNNIYPMLGISVNQDFSGPGNRTRMDSSHRFNLLSPEFTMPSIFSDKFISIQLGSNIYKYNLSLSVKFDSVFSASNFISSIYNTIHVNKHYYPRYADLKYKIDIELYKLLRQIYNKDYSKDEDFLKYLNDHTKYNFIREYDKSSGNIDYFLIIPIRPLAFIQSPAQTDNNTNGARESFVNMAIDLEIELPNTLYFNTPSFLLRDINVKVYEGITIKDENDNKLKEENRIKKKHNKQEINRESNPKIVTMPLVEDEEIKNIHKKELRYTGTVSISELTDIFHIEDRMIITYLNNKDKEYILKIFDEDGKEIIPREVKFYDDSIDVLLDMYVEETILVVNIYG